MNGYSYVQYFLKEYMNECSCEAVYDKLYVYIRPLIYFLSLHMSTYSYVTEERIIYFEKQRTVKL